MNQLVILFDRATGPQDQLVCTLEEALTESGYGAYVDRHLRISVDWARSVDEKIRSADSVLAVISDASLRSEMLRYELEVVADARLKNPQLRFICVPIPPGNPEDDLPLAGAHYTGA